MFSFSYVFLLAWVKSMMNKCVSFFMQQPFFHLLFRQRFERLLLNVNGRTSDDYSCDGVLCPFGPLLYSFAHLLFLLLFCFIILYALNVRVALLTQRVEMILKGLLANNLFSSFS